jgi:hypothetical protein
MKVLNQVAEFHSLFQHPILPHPQIPDQKRCDLRRNLIREEFKELEEAIEARDLKAIADALCDLQYVLSGTVLEFGMKDVFEKMFYEVQRSNMSKACSSHEEAQQTIEGYAKASMDSGRVPDEMHYEEKDGKFLVYRSEDRKTLKSINYSPANLEPFTRLRSNATEETK